MPPFVCVLTHICGPAAVCPRVSLCPHCLPVCVWTRPLALSLINNLYIDNNNNNNNNYMYNNQPTQPAARCKYETRSYTDFAFIQKLLFNV